MGLTTDDVKKLTAPFPKDRLGVKVQSTSRDKTKAMLVLYLQHTDVMDRLEQVDAGWTTTVVSEGGAGETYYVRMRMTVNGISRENVGEGNDPKSAYSDALKRCAMLFGVGRYLYDSDTVWVPYNEQTDRYRQFSVEEYEAATKPAPKQGGTADKAPSGNLVKPNILKPSVGGNMDGQAGVPMHCGEPMGISKWNPNEYFCFACRKYKQPRVA